MKVAVIMGSMSDFEKVEPMIDLLKSYDVCVEARCLSAHRAHASLVEFIEECNNNETEVMIAAAGMAAALPGVVASMTTLPVIGVPLTSKNLEGMDALLSVVQMPSGVPVACVAIDGSKNAGYLALEILGIKYPSVKAKLAEERKMMEQSALSANQKLQERIK